MIDPINCYLFLTFCYNLFIKGKKVGVGMNKLLKLLNRDISALSSISIILSAIIIYWMFNRYALEFFAAIFALFIASVSMLIYLKVTWHHLTTKDRYSIGFSIIAWLFLAYGIVHADGLTLSVLLLNS